jgi:pSer/pThr/pTyr-binding forkhead associated (FHA) protein
MVQLRILSGHQAGAQRTTRRFPFRIGRAPDNDWPLDDDGIWERHASLTFDPAEGFLLRAESDALLSVNHQPVRSARLRNGDCIQIGAATLQFWLAPVAQRPHRWREALVWAFITGIVVLELALIFRLPR